MLTRFLWALLNGIITYAVLLIIAVILGMVGVGAIGAIVERFAWVIALLVAALTFLGTIPSMWPNMIK